MASSETPNDDLAAALRDAYPELDAVAAAATEPVYVVGGAVRDLLLGRERGDLDLVVLGDAFALAARLGADPVEHERFGTAKVVLDGHELDLAGARTESYARPGALPEVAAADSIEADLARRDFTVNAIAVALADEAPAIDPLGGRADLEAGLLRVLHPASFADDPTRAIRAARYAARFGFSLEAGTAGLVGAADLATVSADRRRAELLRLAAEPTALRGLELLAEWGLVDPRSGGIALARAVEEQLGAPRWRGVALRERALLAAALGPLGEERRLSEAVVERPSEGVALAQGRDPVELLLARAMGGLWVDRYLDVWSAVELEIDGADLIAAGVPEGPALGRGLAAARRARLDGEATDREQELAVALAAARTAT